LITKKKKTQRRHSSDALALFFKVVGTSLERCGPHIFFATTTTATTMTTTTTTAKKKKTQHQSATPQSPCNAALAIGTASPVGLRTHCLLTSDDPELDPFFRLKLIFNAFCMNKRMKKTTTKTCTRCRPIAVRTPTVGDSHRTVGATDMFL
jgi:hypothetical protein